MPLFDSVLVWLRRDFPGEEMGYLSVEQSACGVLIGRDTPAPLVEHDEARRRTLVRYAVVKRGAAA